LLAYDSVQTTKAKGKVPVQCTRLRAN